jgi:hypothetical protein
MAAGINYAEHAQEALAYRNYAKKRGSFNPNQRISAAGGIASPYGCAIAATVMLCAGALMSRRSW